MTREEAIAYGKRVIDLGLNDETQAFCTLAISALEKNESAEEWYKLLCEKWDSAENKGEWIEHDVKELRDLGYYRCSVCRKGFKRFDKGIRKSDVPWIDGQPFELHIVDNFCPNCGARMKGGE